MKPAVVLMFVGLGASLTPALGLKGSPPDTQAGFAPLADVRLLGNGLRQLGQSMRDFAQKTRGQLADIFGRLGDFDRSFGRLSALAGRMREEEEELKERMLALTAQNEEMSDLTDESRSKLESIVRERDELRDRVKGLEEELGRKLANLMTNTQVAEINSLREVIRSQETNITALLEAMQGQSQQLFHQKAKIRTLEDKIPPSLSGRKTNPL